MAEEQQEWMYDEETKGTGPKPEWFNDSKYKNISAQAKAQRDLEQKLGDFAASPKEYSVSYPENFPQDLKYSPQELKILENQAKEYNISNRLFNDLYIKNRVQQLDFIENQKKTELEKLGPKATERLQNIENWAKNNLNQEQWQAVKEVSKNAEVVQLIESFIDKTKDTPITAKTQAAEAIDSDYLQKRVADPRYKTDQKFREQTSKMFENFYQEKSEF